MPEALTKEEVESGQDPSVNKQWDRETPMDQQFQELYSACDGIKISMMGTYRQGIGPVARPMAVGKRVGPDFLFVSNNQSKKFQDLEKSPECQIIFDDSKNWVSVSGTATTLSNSDPRLNDIYNKGMSAWFGDLGDGKHDGTPSDPRMALIEVKSKYIAHWKMTTGTLGFMKEVVVGAATGQVATPSVQRQMLEQDIEKARTMASQSSSS